MKPSEASCRGCGKRIVWGISKDGKRIPLDPKPPVYDVLRITELDVHWPRVEMDTVPVVRNEEAYVSHFATCPNASDFSGKNR